MRDLSRSARTQSHSGLPPDDAVPTLGELAANGPDWFWLTCNRCLHIVAMRYAPLIARLGADRSSNVLRKNAACGKCGHRSASITRPAWERGGYPEFPG